MIGSPGALGDPEVVAAANDLWRWMERWICLARRGYGSVELYVWEGGDLEEPVPGFVDPVVHVPAAYVIKLVDLEHAKCRGVESSAVRPLRLAMPVPACLAQQRPESPLPPGVVVATILGALLAVVGVFGRWRTRA